MTKKYIDKIDKAKRAFYSLNFLISELEEIPDISRDLKIINSKTECSVFETKDFKPRVYYKQISSILKPIDYDSNK